MNFRLPATALLALSAAACGAPDSEADTAAPPASIAGPTVAALDTTIEASLEAVGTAAPFAQATLSTKLMGTVLQVMVREGERVSAGAPLVRLDARELEAKQGQVSASIAEAEAVQRDAATNVARFRALYADSAATKAQLEAVETGLARAEAAVRQARAGSDEVRAIAGYATVRAPFAGTITQRFVDPGAFAAPGAPLLSIQDSRKLRLSASITPEAARSLRAGARIAATVEGSPVRAIIEGVVPSMGSLYTVNAIVENAKGDLLPTGAATLSLTQGRRRAVLVPLSAIRREGDLTGVLIKSASGFAVRWVRLGATLGTNIEVTSGLAGGEQLLRDAGSSTSQER